MPTRSWQKVRSDIAHYRKAHPDEPTPVELYQELKAARLAEHIRKTVDSAPPLTPEQRDRIALLLRDGAVTAGGDAA